MNLEKESGVYIATENKNASFVWKKRSIQYLRTNTLLSECKNGNLPIVPESLSESIAKIPAVIRRIRNNWPFQGISDSKSLDLLGLIIASYHAAGWLKMPSRAKISVTSKIRLYIPVVLRQTAALQSNRSIGYYTMVWTALLLPFYGPSPSRFLYQNWHELFSWHEGFLTPKDYLWASPRHR